MSRSEMTEYIEWVRERSGEEARRYTTPESRRLFLKAVKLEISKLETELAAMSQEEGKP